MNKDIAGRHLAELGRVYCIWGVDVSGAAEVQFLLGRITNQIRRVMVDLPDAPQKENGSEKTNQDGAAEVGRVS